LGCCCTAADEGNPEGIRKESEARCSVTNITKPQDLKGKGTTTKSTINITFYLSISPSHFRTLPKISRVLTGEVNDYNSINLV
jgi:hypothetical protein